MAGSSSDLRYMLDTNICIRVMRRSVPHLLQRFDSESDALCISSITLAELHFGVAKSEWRAKNHAALAAFASRLRVLDFDSDAAVHFGSLRSDLERAGTPCGPYDLLIGAHARSLGLTLVTNNRREFDRMPGLSVEDWT